MTKADKSLVTHGEVKGIHLDGTEGYFSDSTYESLVDNSHQYLYNDYHMFRYAFEDDDERHYVETNYSDSTATGEVTISQVAVNKTPESEGTHEGEYAYTVSSMTLTQSGKNVDITGFSGTIGGADLDLINNNPAATVTFTNLETVLRRVKATDSTLYYVGVLAETEHGWIRAITCTITRTGTDAGNYKVTSESYEQQVFVTLSGTSGTLNTIDRDTLLNNRNALIYLSSKNVYLKYDRTDTTRIYSGEVMDNASSTATPAMPTRYILKINTTTGAWSVTEQSYKTMILDMFYPIGTTYISFNSNFDPSVKWGGTWGRISSGYFLEATTVANNVGSTHSAGLPNITGSITPHSAYGTLVGLTMGKGATDGVFSTSTTGNSVYGSNGVGYNMGFSKINFNASSSNSIYGSSTTVQPKSYMCYIWKRTA